MQIPVLIKIKKHYLTLYMKTTCVAAQVQSLIREFPLLSVHPSENSLERKLWKKKKEIHVLCHRRCFSVNRAVSEVNKRE
jgi:hypothetical protein